MNAETSRFRQRVQQEISSFESEAAYRLHALQHLKLKAVVKESHGSPVESLMFNQTSPGCGNLFATVGRNQATVYDDEHMGNHIGVVTQFINESTEHVKGGNLSAMAWIHADEWTKHPYGDACVAVSGEDCAISVISVVEARVIKLLQGHVSNVIDMAAVASQPEMLVSLSKDGTVFLWNIPNEKRLSSVVVPDATSLALTPQGDGIICGTSRGRLMHCNIVIGNEQREHSFDPLSKKQLQLFSCNGSYHTESIDCVRFLNSNTLASKSIDGKMLIWSYPDMQCSAGWKIPGCNSQMVGSSRCSFNTTPDGRYIAAGNSSGNCYVFDSRDGSRVASVSVIRVSAPVRACALSRDCRHLLAAVGNGFIFRFEYVPSINNENDESRTDGSSKDTETVSEGEKENTDRNTESEVLLEDNQIS